MFVVHYLTDNAIVLTQFKKNVPAEGDIITIKGRKGKVEIVKQNEANHIQVHIVFEKVVKKPLNVIDKKKR
ncbi:hypothetical protein [Sutcliffiella halmapala]|uniref:hypothetical protein n=1 Tax=Sutcliffiella halmapala TaxID=79882 RepID=UPI000994AFDF|nr:hypothetical protein [Sutcliffiella halmapala]